MPDSTTALIVAILLALSVPSAADQTILPTISPAEQAVSALSAVPLLLPKNI